MSPRFHVILRLQEPQGENDELGRRSLQPLIVELFDASLGRLWRPLSSNAKCNTPADLISARLFKTLRSVAMRSYSHLSEDERDQIGVLRAAGRSSAARMNFASELRVKLRSLLLTALIRVPSTASNSRP